MNWCRIKQRQGDTLIEVIFALAILATILIVITSAAINSWRVSRIAGERSQASAIVQAQVEALRSYWGGVDWTTFSSTTPINTVPTLLTPGPSFSMQSTVPTPPVLPKWEVKTGSRSDGIYTVVVNRIVSPSLTTGNMRFKVTATWRSIGRSSNNTSDQVVEFGAER